MHAPKSREHYYDSKITVIELIFSHQQLCDFFVLWYKHMPTSSRLYCTNANTREHENYQRKYTNIIVKLITNYLTGNHHLEYANTKPRKMKC